MFGSERLIAESVCLVFSLDGGVGQYLGRLHSLCIADRGGSLQNLKEF